MGKYKQALPSRRLMAVGTAGLTLQGATFLDMLESQSAFGTYSSTKYIFVPSPKTSWDHNSVQRMYPAPSDPVMHPSFHIQFFAKKLDFCRKT